MAMPQGNFTVNMKVVKRLFKPKKNKAHLRKLSRHKGKKIA